MRGGGSCKWERQTSKSVSSPYLPPLPPIRIVSNATGCLIPKKTTSTLGTPLVPPASMEPAVSLCSNTSTWNPKMLPRRHKSILNNSGPQCLITSRGREHSNTMMSAKKLTPCTHRWIIRTINLQLSRRLNYNCKHPVRGRVADAKYKLTGGNGGM